MVTHEHIRVHAPPGAGTRLLERPQKQLAIGVLGGDHLAPAAAINHVIDRPGKLNALLREGGRREGEGGRGGHVFTLDMICSVRGALGRCGWAAA